MTVRLEPWGSGDLPLLTALLGDPAMMEHLGGAESAEKLAERQARYELPETQMFKIVDGEPVGSVGYWPREWRGNDVYEVGWSVLPAAQGHGYATRGMELLLEVVGADADRRRFVHAFPSVENGPSNAICRKLGFTLIEELEFEYPKGSLMRCNDWQLDLRRPPRPAAAA